MAELMKFIKVNVPEGLYEEIENIAAREGRSLSGTVRKYVDRGLPSPSSSDEYRRILRQEYCY